MTYGLYDQIGAHVDAEQESLRAAYSRTLARLNRRRRDLLDQRGDTRKLDLLRLQVEQAWEVLSDPSRRRRYDALLALSENGGLPGAISVWEQAAGVLTSPGAAAAVELLRAATRIQLPDLQPVPGAPVTDEEPTISNDTQADVLTEAVPPVERVARPMPEIPPAEIVPHPAVAAAQQAPEPSPAPSISMPSPSISVPSPGSQPSEPPAATQARSPAPSFSERRAAPPPSEGPAVEEWVAELGWSGALVQRVRESRGLSLRDVGDATKISARYLEAIESDDFGHLPSSTFVKGYLREIARLLDLDESALISGYLRRIS